MSLLQTWIMTPLAGAIGWTLLHSLWQGAIISAALGAVLVATRSARARYAAACMAMLLLLAGFGLTLISVMPENTRGLRITPAPLPPWNLATDLAGPIRSNLGLATIAPWLTPFWIVGVGIAYLGHVAGWISVCRLRRRGVCCVSAFWQRELVRLSASLRVSRPVVLLESCLANTPMVLGHFRPVILLPLGLLTGMSSERIESILLHELAHIRRYDYLLNAFQRLVQGLLFYHPAVWWISGVVRTERENCCDDVVVAMTGNPQEYADALVALEQSRSTGYALAVAVGGGNLVKRIRRLLYPKVPYGAWMPLAATLVLIATGAVAIAAWQSEPPQQRPADPQSKTGRTRSSAYAKLSPYVKWLNEDVVYIITDEERARFQKLTTDEEREKFIAQFWERRNPKPGADPNGENEFLKEHYRRIGYANQRYGTASGRPGWQTDLGHVYIVYGPSDQIETHPNGGTQIEVWTYRHLEGIGDNASITFIDAIGTGDYRLAPGSPGLPFPRPVSPRH